MELNEKKYSVLVYDNTGTFITTINPEEIQNVPTWRESINGGYSQTQLELQGDRFKFDSFGRTTYSAFSNIVRIFELDAENPRGREMFKGYIARRTPFLAGKKEGVKWDINHVSSILNADKYNNGGSPPVFTVSHAAQDPQTVFRAAIDNFQAVFGACAAPIGDLITYSDDTTDPVGTNITQDFIEKTHFEVLNEVKNLAGEGWWWKIDAIGQGWLKPKPSVATHTFTIGLDINDIDAPETAEEIVNYVRVKRTGGMESNYEDTDSQEAYGFGSPTPTGRWTKIINESDIGDVTTADQRGNKELDDNAGAKIKAVIMVNSEYDIASVHVGETCKIANMSIDNDFFNDNMLIGSVDYQGDFIKVSLIEDPMSFADELDRFVTAAV
jgi:hypothetical protein